MSRSATLAGYAFADGTLDRADALREDLPALARYWPQARVLVIDKEGRALADAGGQPVFAEGGRLGAAGPGLALFLGLKDERAWFSIAAEVVNFDAPDRIDLRQAAATWPAFDAGLFALARALMHWHSRTRFCSVCGGAVQFQRAGYLGVCMHCGGEQYPRVDPAVIVAVSDGPRLLLGRKPEWPPGRYSLVAGFVEPGETLEQTVVREVLEETRVRVTGSRYLGAQPWPFPGALMLGFLADAHADTPQVSGELEDARWFSRDDVGAALRGDDAAAFRLPPAISIARALIEHWYRQGDPATSA